jgi:pimeloyl-ACP methyl ester carboxylesterase
MNALKFILYLIIFFPGISLAQKSGLKVSIQKISTGALYYEYFKHSNDTEFPTIVFESGALHSSSYWNHVIESISKHANTIRYDRAGLGRSLPSADTIRSSKQIAEELNELLDSLKVKKKIILVCHSAGGFYGRTFSHQFSNRVKALVLIESPCTRWETLLRSSLAKNQNEERDARLKQNRLELSFYQRKEYQASELNRIILDQIPKMQIPVFIISGNNHHWPENYNVDLLNRNWYECQKSLTNISSNSKIIIVNGVWSSYISKF